MKKKKPNLEMCLRAGLSIPVAVEACLRERARGGRLAHWCHRMNLHAPTVSAVIRGRRKDSTIRAIIAKELGVTEKRIHDLLDSMPQNDRKA